MHRKNLWIVIPTYNEEKVISEMLDKLLKEGYHNILLVNDGSTDATLKIARQKPIQILSHAFNRGVGAATQSGIKLALELGAELIVNIDADCQHDVKDIANLIIPILDGEAEIVLGSRFKSKESGVPLVRRLENRAMNLLTWLLFGLKVSDSQSGFRAFSRKAAKIIKIHGNGFEACSEIIREIAWYKLRYREVPIHVTYSEYSMSKGQSFANGIVTVAKLIARSLMR